ncbi:DNA-binding protein [Longibacter salinarum]|uniref:DNA-binding protein n=1 Tax=Longibacter salinarum TaxID=1850348 RepID=A0A2A8CTC7_9BACT|nr:helix-turn-helix domain-containing protein [Longibacter salinarum]PEN10368.1 DNA-binding protein [Longibacter salinarum]
MQNQVEKPVLDAKEAATRLDLDPSTVRYRCRAGRYPGAFKVGKSWAIPRMAVLEEAEKPKA